MKLMLVVPHLSDGGGERIVSDLSLGLQAEEIVLVVFENKVTYPYKGRLVSLDLPIDRRSLYSRARGFLTRIRAFRSLVRRERPNSVISFMGEANLVNAIVSRRAILTVHNLAGLPEVNRTVASAGTLAKRVESRLAAMLAGFLYRRAAAVVAVSEDIRREIVQRFNAPPDRVHVISNAVNLDQIRRRAREDVSCPWASTSFAVVTAGRLTAAKGHWHLIRAVKEATRKIPVELVILGTGELDKNLKDLVRGLGLEDRVHFLGWQSNPHRYMARCDLFVLPSLTEGFGLVLLEAMACGLPVVVANCPGPPAGIVAPGIDRTAVQEPIFGDYGVVVPALDGVMRGADAPLTAAEKSLADVLIAMARDPGLRQKYRSASARRVVDFSYDRCISQYQSLTAKISTER